VTRRDLFMTRRIGSLKHWMSVAVILLVGCLIALSSKYPKMLPIATVHPYDGQAALDEQFSLAQTLDALERLDLDASEKARIRYTNARRLFSNFGVRE
jgi:hypothetical protein